MTGITPPPGWYPDPSAAGAERYWDGNSWTEHRRPATWLQGPQDQSAPWRPHPQVAGRKYFWQRLSRRGKIFIIADVAVLAALVIVGVVFLSLRDNTGSSSGLYTPPAPPEPPRVSGGLSDWQSDVCPNLLLYVDNPPDNPLPAAQTRKLCVHAGNTRIAIGSYDDQTKLDSDIARRAGPQHYAAGTDVDGRMWLFLVLQGDSSAIAPLKKYGFAVH